MTDRRHALARIALAAFATAAAPAQATGLADRLSAMFSGPSGRLSVVLVDTTGSIAPDDWQLYEQALDALLASASPGDRVMLAQVHDRPASRFSAHTDLVLKSTGNSMHDQVHAKRARKTLLESLSSLRGTGDRPARATLLLDAVGATAEWYVQGRARGQELQLLVLSDMVEESPTANFARQALNETTAKRVIERQRSQELLPDLAGVKVHVVGASGRDAAHMARIRDFWQDYFAATGATLQAYGRSAGSLVR